MNDMLDSFPAGADQEEQPREHYFLVAGEVVYRSPAEPGQKEEDRSIGAIRLNALVTSKNQSLAFTQLARAQQVLQMNFRQRIQEPTVEVVDVIILTLTHLGEFTQEEFRQAPPGMKLQQVNPGA